MGIKIACTSHSFLRYLVFNLFQGSGTLAKEKEIKKEKKIANTPTYFHYNNNSFLQIKPSSVKLKGIYRPRLFFFFRFFQMLLKRERSHS